MALRVLIVDDEEPARSIVREMLALHPGCEIVGEATHGLDAVKRIAELTPDIVFLDVQMPKLDGLEVLELITTRPAIIFTTAYDAYALRAFEVNAVDYLLKPFSADRFAAALERARSRVGQPLPTQLARASRDPDTWPERIVIRDGVHVEILAVSQLDYAAAQGDYVALHAGQRSWLKQQTLQSLEASLDPDQFVRIHRSFLVNIERLARLEPMGKDNKVAVLKDGRQLPVSRSGQARVTRLLSGLGGTR